ncbi:hypothetical protein Tco_0077679 [Tanacetum coccineum]
MNGNIINVSSSTHQEIHKIFKDEIVPIVNQVDAMEADNSLDKIKVLEREIKRLFRSIISQDIMSIVQNNSVAYSSNLQTELDHTKGNMENCIIKKETEYAKLWNDWYTKYWKTCVLTETFMYYQVFRGDGSSKNYKVLSEMLEDFDRLDVEELYRLVKNRYSASSPEGFDLMLWGDLHTLFEPDKDDEIWRDQHEYNLLSWRLCDFCGIHILLMDNGLAIHMLTEKKYPLSQEMMTKMLSRKLEVDHESSQAFELLRFIRSQVQK